MDQLWHVRRIGHARHAIHGSRTMSPDLDSSNTDQPSHCPSSPSDRLGKKPPHCLTCPLQRTSFAAAWSCPQIPRNRSGSAVCAHLHFHGTPFALAPLSPRHPRCRTIKTRGNTMRQNRKTIRTLLCTGAALSIGGPASAAFVDDSKASIELRNFYMNRDFRNQDATQSKAEEWAQGFLLKIESGYTEGPVGFGVDALGLLGVKLDSSAGRSGTGILQRDSSGNPEDDYATAGLTAKAKISSTTLHVGTLQPLIPVLVRNDSRLLPNIYRGA